MTHFKTGSNAKSIFEYYTHFMTKINQKEIVILPTKLYLMYVQKNTLTIHFHFYFS